MTQQSNIEFSQYFNSIPLEWSGVEWSGVEWSGVEWSEVECSGVGSTNLDRFQEDVRVFKKRN